MNKRKEEGWAIDRANATRPSRRWRRRAAAAAGALAFLWLSACTTVPATKSCANADLMIDANFVGGNFHACEIAEGGRASVLIRPEDPPPINQSPWYAFRVSGASEARPLHVTIAFEHGPARYWPKVSRDGRNWTRAAERDVELAEDGNSLTLRVAEAPILWVSGQELVTDDYYTDWLAELSAHAHVQTELLGQSALGRPLFVMKTAPRPEVVVLIGRQHPPEVSGALAMRSFVDTVLGDSQLAHDFRARYSLVIMPLINPDGVALGYWRHNVNGIDLNRDWGPFTQPETQGAQRLLASLERSGARPALMLDFHSTRESLFYTQLPEESSWSIDFASVWFERFRERRPDFEFKHDPRPRSVQPNTKNYFFDRYRVPAITYEIGDEEDRTAIEDTTPVFAEEMMRLLLEYSATEQTANRGNAAADADRPPPLPLPAQ